jgi:hypothetical protein
MACHCLALLNLECPAWSALPSLPLPSLPCAHGLFCTFLSYPDQPAMPCPAQSAFIWRALPVLHPCLPSTPLPCQTWNDLPCPARTGLPCPVLMARFALACLTRTDLHCPACLDELCTSRPTPRPGAALLNLKCPDRSALPSLAWPYPALRSWPVLHSPLLPGPVCHARPALYGPACLDMPCTTTSTPQPGAALPC